MRRIEQRRNWTITQAHNILRNQNHHEKNHAARVPSQSYANKSCVKQGFGKGEPSGGGAGVGSRLGGQLGERNPRDSQIYVEISGEVSCVLRFYYMGFFSATVMETR